MDEAEAAQNLGLKAAVPLPAPIKNMIGVAC